MSEQCIKMPSVTVSKCQSFNSRPCKETPESLVFFLWSYNWLLDRLDPLEERQSLRKRREEKR